MNASASGQIRILIVDDNPDIQSVLSISLEHFGYLVDTAGDAETALAVLDRNPVHMAIIDYGLPTCDGVELGRRILEHPVGADVRMLLFSGSHDATIAEQATEVGFVAYLVKPLRINVLVEKLQLLEP